MECPRVLARERLVALDLRGGVYMPGAIEGPLAEIALDTVVDGEVDRPRWEVAEDRRPKAAIHAADAVVLEDVLDGRWERGTGGDAR